MFTSMTSFLACLYIKITFVHIKIKCLKDKYIGIICLKKLSVNRYAPRKLVQSKPLNCTAKKICN